ADLGDQLTDIPDGEILELLGSPEHFVAEYRASAGFAQSDPSPAAVPPSRSGSSRMSVAVLVVGLVGVFVVWFLSPATSEQSPLVSILSLAFPVAVLVIGALTVLRAVRA